MLAQLLVSHSCLWHWTFSLREAAEWLGRSSARVAICDDQLSDGHWQELWDLCIGRLLRQCFIVSASWAVKHHVSSMCIFRHAGHLSRHHPSVTRVPDLFD
jgi:hypothetical protein